MDGSTAAVILCAGMGSRIGLPEGENKCAVSIAGTSPIRHTAASLLRRGVSQIFVVRSDLSRRLSPKFREEFHSSDTLDKCYSATQPKGAQAPKVGEMPKTLLYLTNPRTCWKSLDTFISPYSGCDPQSASFWGQLLQKSLHFNPPFSHATIAGQRLWSNSVLSS